MLKYEVNFGTPAPGPGVAHGSVFRLALLGDFSGRASKGEAATGKALAGRKPLRVDVDNLDTVLERLAPRIVLPFGDEGTVEVPLASMDDFHPDQLVEALPLFEQLLSLRRDLQSRSGFERAMKEVLSWAGSEPLPPPATRRARGGSIALDRTLSDFARLTGLRGPREASADDLIRRLVGPFVVPATDSRQEALLARVDAALSDAMRRVLHHPDFQCAEALWRGVEMLVRGLETGARLQIVLYDISAEELAADLASTDNLADTALHSLLIEQPATDADAGPLAMIIGLYGFELAPPHIDLLGRLAQLTGGAGAPFVSAIGPDALREPEHEWHPLIRSAWSELRALPAAAYLGLATPRFLLRAPYGKRSDPIDAFAFEEFNRQSGLSGMLWGHPGLLVALCAGQAWLKGGNAMQLGSISVVGDLAVYVYRDADGDQMALPCTERLFPETQAAKVSSVGAIPIVSLRGRPEVRVAGFGSVAGRPLAGRWAPVDLTPKPAAKPPPPAKTPVPQAAQASPAPVAPSPPAAPPALAPTPTASPPNAAPPPEETAAATELDSLLDDLGVATSAPSSQTVEANEPAPDELENLLASLNAEPPPAGPDETEADLDALLASLKQ
jgi:type VI secretion system protein ImpC